MRFPQTTSLNVINIPTKWCIYWTDDYRSWISNNSILNRLIHELIFFTCCSCTLSWNFIKVLMSNQRRKKIKNFVILIIARSINSDSFFFVFLPLMTFGINLYWWSNNNIFRVCLWSGQSIFFFYIHIRTLYSSKYIVRYSVAHNFIPVSLQLTASFVDGWALFFFCCCSLSLGFLVSVRCHPIVLNLICDWINVYLSRLFRLIIDYEQQRRWRQMRCCCCCYLLAYLLLINCVCGAKMYTVHILLLMLCAQYPI